MATSLTFMCNAVLVLLLRGSLVLENPKSLMSVTAAAGLDSFAGEHAKLTLSALKALATLLRAQHTSAAFIPPETVVAQLLRGGPNLNRWRSPISESGKHPNSRYQATIPQSRGWPGLRIANILMFEKNSTDATNQAAKSAIGPGELSSPSSERVEKTLSTDKLDLEKLKTQFASFWEMALPYFKDSSSGRKLLGGVIALTVLSSGVDVVFSYVLRDFFTALSEKDVTLFQTILAQFAGVLVVAVPLVVYYGFLEKQLAVDWREWMTKRTLQLYYSNRVYYSLERGGEIDNPDQRITEDVRSFTAFSLNFFTNVLTSSIDLVSFSIILYSIQPQLFGGIIAYATFGTVTASVLGRKLIRLNFDKLQREADFRYALVRFRENAESIAFYGGEDSEGEKVSVRLKKVVNNTKDILVAQRNLEFFTNSYNFLVQVLPVAIAAPQYFAGSIQLGVIRQSAEAFNSVLSDLSLLVDEFESLSSFSAGIDRLSSFMNMMREVDMGRPIDSALMQPAIEANTTSDKVLASLQQDNKSETNIELIERENVGSAVAEHVEVLVVRNLSLATPDRRRILIEELDLSLQQGENLLIVGNSGAGKSSFLRAIAGLWTAGSGSIERPSQQDVYFLPQKPYCSMGSLKEQLLYPNVQGNDTDDYQEGSHILKKALSNEDLLEILRAIDLEELPKRAGDGDPIKGLETVLDWSNTLSLGEQQRLAFGRLLVNRPRLAILDEATSALDVDTEAKMYKLLQDMAHEDGTSLTFVSVGHRPSLLTYHDFRLRLSGQERGLMNRINKSLSE